MFFMAFGIVIESSHAAVTTTETEELRNRSKQEALERERQQQVLVFISALHMDVAWV